jgi:hypothetical protein
MLKRLIAASETFEQKNPKKRRNAKLSLPFHGEKLDDSCACAGVVNPGVEGPESPCVTQ